VNDRFSAAIRFLARLTLAACRRIGLYFRL
jgi:hypothetical protein